MGEPLNEEVDELRLEAGAVGDLVQAVGCPLLAGPELVGEGLNGNSVAIPIGLSHLNLGGPSIPGESPDRIRERRSLLSRHGWVLTV